MDSNSPLLSSSSDNPAIVTPSFNPDVSNPIEEEVSLNEAIEEVCSEIFHQPLEKETYIDEDNTPLTNLRSNAFQKLRVTRGKNVMKEGTLGSFPDRVAKLFAEVDDTIETTSAKISLSHRSMFCKRVKFMSSILL